MEDEGTRVVLARRENSMIRYRWTGKEPAEMSEVDEALELGASWEGDELVTYDLPGMTGLFEHYRSGEYMPDND